MYGFVHKFASIFFSFIIVKNRPLFSLILELCLPFLNFAGWHLCRDSLTLCQVLMTMAACVTVDDV